MRQSKCRTGTLAGDIPAEVWRLLFQTKNLRKGVGTFKEYPEVDEAFDFVYSRDILLSRKMLLIIWPLLKSLLGITGLFIFPSLADRVLRVVWDLSWKHIFPYFMHGAISHHANENICCNYRPSAMGGFIFE